MMTQKDVGLPSIPGPDMQLKKQVNKTVARPSCTDVF